MIRLMTLAAVAGLPGLAFAHGGHAPVGEAAGHALTHAAPLAVGLVAFLLCAAIAWRAKE